MFVAEQLRRREQPPSGILLEPVGRNTEPALTAAAHTRATVDKRELSPIEVQAGANAGKDEYKRLQDA